MNLDKDLQSIQEVRDLIVKAKQAQKELAKYSQEEIDDILCAIAEACDKEAVSLAKMAVEETGFGIWEDKVLKNKLGSTICYDYIKDMKTVGIIKEDPVKKVTEVASPMGIIAALIPSTNPTSTVMYKSLISIKGGNSVIISPHPNAQKCIIKTAEIIRKAADAAGAPENIVQVIKTPTIQATNTLMSHKDTAMILATGGEGMVHAAYSSGTPALGVGPGNGPAFIEKTADIHDAISKIIASKTFDNGTICASEQSIIAEECNADEILDELEAQGGYIMDEEESEKLAKFIMRANNTMNPAIVGKSALKIAEMADIDVPEDTKVLVSIQTEVGKNHPYSREKLCPILAFFIEEDWESACDRSMEILYNEGAGHTMTIHSNDDDVIREFALTKPVSRLMVNTPASVGGVGATTGLQPALTLGCGTVGGSATSNNVGPMDLINIRRVAYGLKTIDELRAEGGQTSSKRSSRSSKARSTRARSTKANRTEKSEKACSRASRAKKDNVTSTDIEAITKAVLDNILNER